MHRENNPMDLVIFASFVFCLVGIGTIAVWIFDAPGHARCAGQCIAQGHAGGHQYAYTMCQCYYPPSDLLKYTTAEDVSHDTD